MGDRVDIRTILAAWGRSKALSDSSHLYYPSVSPYCKDMRSTGRWSSKLPNIKEENHLFVDSQVSELKTRGDRRHSAIVLCYVYGARDIDIAKELKCSKASAREARIAGENWLDAKVEIDQDSL
jgi:hypothetical protein